MKVSIRNDDLGAIACHALAAVAPATRGLDRGLHGLGAGIHGKRRVQSGSKAEFRQERAEPIVVISARRYREPASLRGQCRKNAGVRVAVACGRIRAHHIDVAATVGIPEKCASAAGQNDRQRCIVMGAVAAFQFDRVHDAALRFIAMIMLDESKLVRP